MKTIATSIVLGLCIAAHPAFAKDKIEKITFKFAENSRIMYVVVPERPEPMPLIVLLHGTGRDGEIMAQAWRDLASREGFMVAAPDSLDPDMWASINDPPVFFRTLVDRVKTRHAIDESRIYLFGHSGGAAYALFLALKDSDLFAATAVHAGALQATPPRLFQEAERKAPIAIWVGDHDRVFTVDAVQATARLYEANGFSVKVTVIPDHDHNYYAIFDQVNRQAWDFLKTANIPSESKDAAQPK
jgi:poly(3-hydroxybutyrate) depolymerase